MWPETVSHLRAIAVLLPLTLMLGCGAEPEVEPTTTDALSADDAEISLGEAEEATASQPADSGSDGTDATEPSLVWSPAELKTRLSDDGLRIVDARSGDAYAEAHIPGAVHVDVADWKSQASVEGGLQDSAAWAERLGAIGIGNETTVLVYGDSMPSTARIWWTLKYVGVGDAAVLDGGWQAWLAEMGDSTTEATNVEQADFMPEFQAQRLAQIGDVKDSLGGDGVTIVDTRSDREFSGDGHIPGAVHLEWSELLDDEGRFKSPAELRELFASSGIDPESEAVTYCRSGGRASVEALALELAGYKNVKNYYCSWQEWSADPAAPVQMSNDE